MNVDQIDTVIAHVATFLVNNTLDQIHQGMLDAGLTEDEIFLIVKAAQIIQADQASAPLSPKPLVRRIIE